MLKLFNTMSREVEEFNPLNNSEVTYYTCGPTVYNFAHIGNLRTYVFEDILKRALLFNGYSVKHAMNITDVGHLTSDNDTGEDKIEQSARLESKNAWEVADFYANAFKMDLQKLNIIEPDIWCKATDHINEQIELIKKLEKNKFIYKISDGLYFDTSKFKEYGQLARLNLAGQEEGARVAANPEKRNPTDFAVWKFSPKDVKRQMEWETTWGKGFPGWHLECSAMSMKYLGETIDIHAGGIDHIPVHHTNEIAQSESSTGKQFVRYWVHGDFLLIDENRMGKSEGNFITMKTLEEKGFDPLVYRFFCLSAHYRSKLNFTWEALKNAENSWQRLKIKFMNLGRQTGKVNVEFIKKFNDEINEDLAIPQAVAVMWNVFSADMLDADKRATILEFDKIFGLKLAEAREEEQKTVPVEIDELVEKRRQARQKGKWEKADDLRKEIETRGWQVEDTADGERIKKG